MSQIYYEDEWKTADDVPAPVVLRTRTRAEQQAFADAQLARGEITREQWSYLFDHISSLRADGTTRIRP